ncbi:unnamed protein product [Adineta ricciae]|uniref:Uncharacterized protein n=1 Tax=Adineta ricciae TaxID=249248 RepID=A0A815SS24_ADIRI|nr:unnamed protein product [Adineta ricciae]CAF1497316.1 unnamed protein product [Adineta ricciae]
MASNASFEPIAIVGIACEFAGDIHTPTEFWQALEERRSLDSEIPIERTDLMSYCAHMFNQDSGEFRRKLIRRGYFLPTSVLDTFDAGYFNLSDGDAVSMDPCHRLLMLKFVHLIDDACYTLEKIRGSRTAVYIGQFSNDHVMATLRLKPEQRTRYHCPNILLYNASARLSYHFDLHGPNVSLDTACSSSLQAVQFGVQALRAGEADMAVCGAVNTVLTPEQLLNFSSIGAIAVDGRSRAFSDDANGYAKGEGLGLVLLKRLSDAERDGDRIYCVLRDILSNHDGSENKNGYVVPSAAGQERLLNEIYTRTQYDKNRIFYAEAHGTGTQVGDPIEANTIGKFFQRSSIDPPLLIGSVKTSVGHTEGAAGIASLIKVCLSMKYRRIPPNMHFKTFNPKIEAQRYNLHVVQTIVPFPSFDPSNPNEYPVAISVSSFGIGGNNAHAIIEEYRPKQIPTITNEYNHSEQLQQYFLFLFSTKSGESLHKQVELFHAWLLQITVPDDEESFLAHISQQCLLKRTISYEHVAVFISANLTQLRQQLDSFISQHSSSGVITTKRLVLNNPRICFVFSGQGPQWWAMGRQLYSSEPVFRRWVQLISAEFLKINGGEYNILEEMIQKSEQESRINDTNIAQPALFSIQVALAALLLSWHIFPSAIVSHSAGEQAAAFVAGRLSLPEAICLVYHRSRLQHRNTRQGGRMLAVAMDEQEARDLLLQGVEDRVCVAVVNSPRSITLSGDEEIIDEIETILSTFYPKVFKARLRIQNAFHSHQMDRFGIKEEMLSTLQHIRGLPLQDKQMMFNINCAHVPFYSCVTGRLIDDNTPLDAEYWWSNVRQCIRFRDAIQTINNHGLIDTFLEISPHPVLGTSIRECYEKTTSTYPLILPTLKRKEDEQITLLTSIAQLSHSLDVWHHYLSSRSIQANGNMQHLFDTFPLYAFNLTPCWYESKESAIERRAYRIPQHPLLGVRQWSGHTSSTWRSLININLPEHAYLTQHKIRNSILLPATAFVEMALAACYQLLQVTASDDVPPPIAFENIEFIKVLSLSTHELTEVITQVVMPMREWFIYSRPWSASGQDCLRLSGMSCNDFVDSFDNQQALNTYSLREFTLHARGSIDIGPHLNIYASAAVRFDEQTANWPYIDNEMMYSHPSTRGFQYGPIFKVTNWAKCVTSKITSSVSPRNEEHKDNRYHLHPVVTDGSLQAPLFILPGEETFLPVSLGKMVIYGSTYNASEIICNVSYHSSLAGLSQEHAVTLDSAIFNSQDDIASPNTKPIAMFQMFKYQRQTSHWSPSNKSLIEKVNELVAAPNGEFTEYLPRIITTYCLQKKWSHIQIDTSKTVNLLPSLDILINNVDQAEKINDDINSQLTNSIQSLNVLTAKYALYALQYLSSLNNIQCINEHELKHHVRNDEPYFLWLFEAMFSLVRQYELIDQVGNPSLSMTNHLLQLSRKQILDQFPLLTSLLSLLNANGLQLGPILSGTQSVGDLFTNNKDNEQFLGDVLNIIASAKTHQFFQVLIDHLCIHHSERLRILIVGSGTSSITIPILEQLISFADQTDTYVDLLYVDLTETLLTEAEKTLQPILTKNNTKNKRISLSYHVYDVQAEFDESNITVEAYDVVFAANVLQTTVNVSHSVDSLRHFLVPGGLLCLLELTITHSYYDLLFGILAQWWRDRGSRAPLTLDQWVQVIQSANGFDLSIVSSKEDQFGNTLIVARKSTLRSTLLQLPEWQEQAWLVLGNPTNNTKDLFDTLLSHLPSSNNMLLQDDLNIEDICLKIKDMLAKYRQLHIVFTSPLELIALGQDSDEIVFKRQQELCNIFIRILQTIQQYRQTNACFPYIFLLTQNTQPINSNQRFNLSATPLIGLARSLRIEYGSHHIKLIDLQTTASTFTDSAFSTILIQHMINSRTVDDLEEIVLHQTVDNHIERFKWHYDLLSSKDPNELSADVETTIVPQKDADMNPFRLEVAPSRFVSDLKWTKQFPLTNTLLPGQILVRVHCVGLNFRDVLKARGLYPHTRKFAELDKDQPLYDRDTTIGSDLMGIVVHSNSNCFNIGDRVTGLHLFGTFNSHIITNELSVIRVSEDCLMSDEQLGSLPTAFLTALLSLKYRIQLKRSHIVLIHAATGATGQACIQYCQAVNAQVIATAGSEEKRRFLREHYGIEHVFNSRDLSFVNKIRCLFPDGVNVVVNSLSGPFLQESVKLLAAHGHFIELGKRDIFGRSNLSMFELREDCNFHVIDLALHGRDDPNNIQEMLRSMMEYYRTGLFKPIEPLTIFEPSDVVDAFTQCSLGQSIGKIVVRMTTSDKPLRIKKANSSLHTCADKLQQTMFPSLVCDNGTILISGGLGGLGLTMACWMIEKRNVKRIVLLSRRTLAQFEQSDHNPQLNEWIHLKEIATEYGALIEVAQVDVTQFDAVYELMKRLNETSYPVRGIIHSAVISDDKLLPKLKSETLARVKKPKVHGGWALHRASLMVQAPIHFFIMFSSLRNHLMDLGSSGYNAGNEFFEVLAQYRYQQLRLPALAVGLPAISGAGMFHRQKNLLSSLYSSQGLEILPTGVSFEIIERLFATQAYYTSPTIFAVNWQQLNAQKNHLSNHQLVEIVEQQINQIEATQISTTISDNLSKDTVETIVERTRVAVMRLLGMTSIARIDVDRSLISQGMDSLVAVSLCNWLVQEWGAFVALSEIFQGISINQIANQVHRKMNDRLEAAAILETTTSTDKNKSDMTEETEEAPKTNKTLSYNGMEKVISMLPVKHSKANMFYISHKATLETEFTQKLADNKSNVYVIHASNDTSNMDLCVQETITQIRRIQPRGPYSVSPATNESKDIVHATVKQLAQYAQANIMHQC